MSQMVRLRKRLALAADPLFVTFDVPQARSLLAGERVEWVPYIGPRGYAGMLRAVPRAFATLRREQPEVLLSTGAGMAVPYFVAARALGQPAVYLESVSRFVEPSLTGKLLARTPGVDVFTQHPGLANERWGQGPCMLDDYSIAGGNAPLPDNPRVSVTLGTIRPYRFDRLLDRVMSIAKPGWKVTWQVGCTERTDLPGRTVREMSSAEFDQEVMDSDVVISHAGVGSAIRILELGRSPVLVPRDPAHGEHVDGHQRQIAAFLSQRGIAQAVDASGLVEDDLRRAAELSVSFAPDAQGGGKISA